MKIWCFRTRDTAIRWHENAAASATPSPQRRTGVSERTTITSEPSFHFESRFSGVQLLVVESPSTLACVARDIFGETRVSCDALMLIDFCDILQSYHMSRETLFAYI